jgi:hypothetical protein
MHACNSTFTSLSCFRILKRGTVLVDVVGFGLVLMIVVIITVNVRFSTCFVGLLKAPNDTSCVPGADSTSGMWEAKRPCEHTGATISSRQMLWCGWWIAQTGTGCR